MHLQQGLQPSEADPQLGERFRQIGAVSGRHRWVSCRSFSMLLFCAASERRLWLLPLLQGRWLNAFRQDLPLGLQPEAVSRSCSASIKPNKIGSFTHSVLEARIHCTLPSRDKCSIVVNAA
jgi:hypothetical protein